MKRMGIIGVGYLVFMVFAYLYCLPQSKEEIVVVSLYSIVYAGCSWGILKGIQMIDHRTGEEFTGTTIILLLGAIALVLMTLDIVFLILQRNFNQTPMVLSEIICIYTAWMKYKERKS